MTPTRNPRLLAVTRCTAADYIASGITLAPKSCHLIIGNLFIPVNEFITELRTLLLNYFHANMLHILFRALRLPLTRLSSLLIFLTIF